MKFVLLVIVGVAAMLVGIRDLTPTGGPLSAYVLILAGLAACLMVIVVMPKSRPDDNPLTDMGEYVVEPVDPATGFIVEHPAGGIGLRSRKVRAGGLKCDS